ncbi:hypothetical protein GCM10009621_16320 [Corynebacterium felinum]
MRRCGDGGAVNCMECLKQDREQAGTGSETKSAKVACVQEFGSIDGSELRVGKASVDN